MGELDTIRGNLAGVQRVFLSGGEPLLRRDFGEIVDMYSGEFIVGVPTNATRGLRHAAAMVGKVAFVNVGLEGPRATTNRVRGDYDRIMSGLRAFVENELPTRQTELTCSPWSTARSSGPAATQLSSPGTTWAPAWTGCSPGRRFRCAARRACGGTGRTARSGSVEPPSWSTPSTSRSAQRWTPRSPRQRQTATVPRGRWTWPGAR